MKKYKWPFLVMACLPFVGISTITTSCSNVDEQYKQQVIDEFIGNKDLNIGGLVSAPRPGYYHDKIVPYLKQRIKDITGCADNEIKVDNAGNICFDIPATTGYENKDMLILQAHTDMVVAGLSEEETKTKPIDAIIDGDIIHSRDWKTSIGADDGAGVATMLAFLRNRNDFKHGPLRFLFSADEDVGMVGASKVSEEWFRYNNNKWAQWLINIDMENVGDVCRSCAGNVRLIYSKEYEVPQNEAELPNEYVLSINGLIGGHSGDLEKKANADRLAYEFLYEFAKNNDIQIISHNHIGNDGADEKFSANQIINHCQIRFACGLIETAVEEKWNACVSSWRTKYSDENWNDIVAKSKITSEASTRPFISIDNSKALAKFWGNTDIDVTQQELTGGIYYGNLKMDGNIPLASSNIGPITIAEQQGENVIKLDAWTSARSAKGDSQSEIQYSVNWIKAQYEKMAQNAQITVEEGPIYYPWEKEDNNELVQILFDGYKQLGTEPVLIDSTGGAEPAWWTQKSQGHTTCACIGATVKNVHNTTEALYIDSIVPVYKNILNAIEKVAEKN